MIWSPTDNKQIQDGLIYLGSLALILYVLVLRGRTWADHWSGTHLVDADSEASLAVDRAPRYVDADPASP